MLKKKKKKKKKKEEKFLTTIYNAHSLLEFKNLLLKNAFPKWKIDSREGDGENQQRDKINTGGQ